MLNSYGRGSPLPLGEGRARRFLARSGEGTLETCRILPSPGLRPSSPRGRGLARANSFTPSPLLQTLLGHALRGGVAARSMRCRAASAAPADGVVFVHKEILSEWIT